jgi:hypothetical protein
VAKVDCSGIFGAAEAAGFVAAQPKTVPSRVNEIRRVTIAMGGLLDIELTSDGRVLPDDRFGR